jgi:hypothetical protein
MQHSDVAEPALLDRHRIVAVHRPQRVVLGVDRAARAREPQLERVGEGVPQPHLDALQIRVGRRFDSERAGAGTTPRIDPRYTLVSPSGISGSRNGPSTA